MPVVSLYPCSYLHEVSPPPFGSSMCACVGQPAEKGHFWDVMTVLEVTQPLNVSLYELDCYSMSPCPPTALTST